MFNVQLFAGVHRLPRILRLPEFQQHDHGSDRTERGDDVDEPRPVIIGNEELRNRERDPGGQGGRPHAEHSAPAGLRPHDPERNDEREERELPADHLREGKFVDAGDFAQRNDRCAERAERDGCGVGDERESRGGERLEAELNENGCGHGDGCAEAGCAFKEGTEGERDEDDLNAGIGCQVGEVAAQNGEETFLNSELVEEDQVQNDPANGEESVTGTEEGGRGGGFHGHVIRADGDGECDTEPEQRRKVNAHVQPSDRAEQDDDGNRSDEGGEQGVAEWIVILRPGHGECAQEKGNRAGGQACSWGGTRLPDEPDEAQALMG